MGQPYLGQWERDEKKLSIANIGNDGILTWEGSEAKRRAEKRKKTLMRRKEISDAQEKYFRGLEMPHNPDELLPGDSGDEKPFCKVSVLRTGELEMFRGSATV